MDTKNGNAVTVTVNTRSSYSGVANNRQEKKTNKRKYLLVITPIHDCSNGDPLMEERPKVSYALSKL